MKKAKPQRTTRTGATEADREFPWWPTLGALAAFVLVWIVYGPALHGAFVFDDRFAPFLRPEMSYRPFLEWIGVNRPLLMATFWVNFQAGGTEPFGYHVVNVFLHFGTSVTIGLAVAKLLALAGTKGTKNTALALFGGALFLLHPVQTESVAYVVSRSETLSVLFYFSAYLLFLYRPEGPVSWPRALGIAALMIAAFSTKEHTVTLPVLLLLTDYFFNPRGIRENLRVYGLFALVAAGGAISVVSVLSSSSSAGFKVESMSPATYAFTQCRVIWIYVREFLLPYGLNLDPDIPKSKTLLEHGAIFGLAGLIVGVGLAWVCRKSWPLASFGFLLFLMLLAPTSSIVPILDVMAEHRLYLPFLGLILIAVDVLRRVTAAQATWTCIAVLAICSVLTYQRSQVWGDPLLLWSDAVSKSPRKARPNFSLAYSYYLRQQCAKADEYFKISADIGQPSSTVLMDWALNDECLGRYEDGLKKLRQSDAVAPSATTKATMAILYGAQQRWPEVLAALDAAEKADPEYPYTYTYRGDYYEVKGDYDAAAAEYRRAVAVAPWLKKATDGLARVTAARR